MKEKILLGHINDEMQGKELKVYLDLQRGHNHHHSLIGKSGGGKTSLMILMAISSIENGATGVIFDYNHVLAEDQVLPALRERFKKVAHDIDVYADGFRCQLLSSLKRRDGTMETPEDVTDSFAEIIGNNMQHAGARQRCRLKEAALEASRYYEQKGIAAVGDVLDDIGDVQSVAILDKMGALFRHNVFRAGELSIQKGKLNVVRLSNYARDLQFTITELILDYLLRLSSCTNPYDSHLSIFVDEAQNLCGAQGIVSKLLTEGRKYGISVAVATQSLEQIRRSKTLHSVFQASNVYFFQPARDEIEEIARYIDRNRMGKWCLRLKNLQVGEFVAVGPLMVDGQPVNRPLLVSARLASAPNDCQDKKSTTGNVGKNTYVNGYN